MRFDEGVNRLRVADHMLSTTYKLVNDPKILLSVVNNILSAMDSFMTALLDNERRLRRIPPFPSSFRGRFSVFARLAGNYGISNDIVRCISELREILHEHESSPVEFRRKDKFVICDDSYRIRTLTVDDVKKHLGCAKRMKVIISDLLTAGR